MGMVETNTGTYIIQPVSEGGGRGTPHIMYSINDWSYLGQNNHSIDGKGQYQDTR